MKKQNYEIKNDAIRRQFELLKKKCPRRFARRLELSWSNWGFGAEKFHVSVARLAANGVKFIELHGNHYGPDLGYRPRETRTILGDHGVKAAGICGMFSPDNDLSSNRACVRQAALDYIRRELDFGADVGASYMLVVPGAVGRPVPCDHMEFERSAETLRLVAGEFAGRKILAAIEPIRSAEVSIVHTIADAKRYIALVNHPGVRCINGDAYHMLAEEEHVGAALLEAGPMLVNLHMADSNRRALGCGVLDLDTIIMALYCINFNRAGCFVTPEPLGPGGDPYPAMHGRPDGPMLDRLVRQTVDYFREREQALLG